MRTTLRTITAAVASAGLLAAIPAAAAAKDGDVERRAGCAGGSIELKVGARDGGREVEVEVDTNRSGQRWTVTVRRNGSRLFSATRTTGGRSGSFSVERRASGGGTFSARAVQAGSGRVCSVSLTA